MSLTVGSHLKSGTREEWVQGLYLMPVVVTERQYMLTVPRVCIAAYSCVTRVSTLSLHAIDARDTKLHTADMKLGVILHEILQV